MVGWYIIQRAITVAVITREVRSMAAGEGDDPHITPHSKHHLVRRCRLLDTPRALRSGTTR